MSNTAIRIYHFTGRDHIAGIRKEGIRAGTVYTPDGNFYRGWTWLTADFRFDAQHWATNRSGMCGDRTEIRIAIQIPQHAIGLLVPWSKVYRLFGISKTDFIGFNLAGCSDGESWFLYRGDIPQEWIVEVVQRESSARAF